MKANELRKGNLIFGKISEDEEGNDLNESILCEFLGYDPFEGNFWVDAVEEKKAREYYDSFEPIPLTEEWLLKFGFNKSNKLFYSIQAGQFFDISVCFKKGPSGCFGSVAFESNEFDKGIGYMLAKCESVHQLQNLYFALTGSELPTDHCKLPTE